MSTGDYDLVRFHNVQRFPRTQVKTKKNYGRGCHCNYVSLVTTSFFSPAARYFPQFWVLHLDALTTLSHWSVNIFLWRWCVNRFSKSRIRSQQRELFIGLLPVNTNITWLNKQIAMRWVRINLKATATRRGLERWLSAKTGTRRDEMTRRVLTTRQIWSIIEVLLATSKEIVWKDKRIDARWRPDKA